MSIIKRMAAFSLAALAALSLAACSEKQETEQTAYAAYMAAQEKTGELSHTHTKLDMEMTVDYDGTSIPLTIEMDVKGSLDAAKAQYSAAEVTMKIDMDAAGLGDDVSSALSAALGNMKYTIVDSTVYVEAGESKLKMSMDQFVANGSSISPDMNQVISLIEKDFENATKTKKGDNTEISMTVSGKTMEDLTISALDSVTSLLGGGSFSMDDVKIDLTIDKDGIMSNMKMAASFAMTSEGQTVSAEFTANAAVSALSEAPSISAPADADQYVDVDMSVS